MLPISVSVFQPSGDGVDFTSSGDSLVVDPGITVLSEAGGNGVSGFIFYDETVLNKGTISAADPVSGIGLLLPHGSSSVTNNAGALISGAFGVGLEGSGIDSVINVGNIIGNPVAGVIIDGTPASISINNVGYIFGFIAAIAFEDSTVGASLVNGGMLSSDAPNNGGTIYLFTTTNIVTNINNLSQGVISGPSAIYAVTGMFNLYNQGTIFGDIRDVDNENDVITNLGHINGDIFLGGNSVFNGSGGTSGPIHVGDGNATVTGGLGADQFVFDSAPTGQFTKITNFTTKQHDKIVLSEADFPNIGPLGKLTLSHFDEGRATHTHPEIVYTRHNGFLYYDSNESHHGGLHHIATFSSHPNLIYSAFIVEA
jgi:hypothetical protein